MTSEAVTGAICLAVGVLGRAFGLGVMSRLGLRNGNGKTSGQMKPEYWQVRFDALDKRLTHVGVQLGRVSALLESTAKQTESLIVSTQENSKALTTLIAWEQAKMARATHAGR